MLMDAEQEIVRITAESERQRRLYETVLTNTPDFVYVFSLDHKVLYANDALIKMWGRGHAGAIGKTFLEIGYEPWHAAMHDGEIDQVRATGQPIRGEVPFTGTSGRRYYDYIFVPVIGADGEVEAVAGTTRDITERKEAERQLREGQEQLDFALTAADLGQWTLDLTDHTVRRTLRHDQLFGYDVLLPEWTYEMFLQHVIADDRAAVDASFRKSVATGSAWTFECRIRRADGAERHLWFKARIRRDAQGQVEQMLGIVGDSTDRWQAEERVRASEERRRLALDGAELGAWHIDPASRVLTTDDRFRMIFANTTEPMDYEQAFAAIHPEDRERVRAAMAAATRTQDPVPYAEEYRVIHPHGSVRWVFAKGRANYERKGEGRLVSFDGTVADITAGKCIEEERERLVGQLRDADRRKNEFLATLAHELRNPLAPIRNGLQVMRLAGVSGTIEQTLDMMERQTTQLVRLVDDLLDMNRVTSGKLELRRQRVELRTVIDAAIETSSPALVQAGHALAVAVPDGSIFVDGDATRLAQVISNLLNNAAKYTHRGGRIRLAVRRENGMAVVVVADDGIGIPPAMLGRVFEMFTQVDRALEKTTGGLGIGLSLVKGLVEMHGGTIEARSEGEGRGSEFIVRLPEALSAGQAIEQTSAEAPVGSTRRRILVTDDNVDSAESLGQLLQLLGNDVTTAYDGSQAVEVAESLRPDVILLDIGMPKLNGFEACRRIRERPWGKDAILVAMTGWGQDEDKRRSQEAGFDHHLVKPVDPVALEKLLATVKTKST